MAFLNQSGVTKLVSNTTDFVKKSINLVKSDLESKLINDSKHITYNGSEKAYPNVDLSYDGIEYSAKIVTVPMKTDSQGVLIVCPESDLDKLTARIGDKILTNVCSIRGNLYLIANDIDSDDEIIPFEPNKTFEIELWIYECPTLRGSYISDIQPLFDTLDYISADLFKINNIGTLRLHVGGAQIADDKSELLNGKTIILDYTEDNKSQFWTEWTNKGWWKIPHASTSILDRNGDSIKNTNLTLDSCAFKWILPDVFNEITLSNCTLDIKGINTVRIGYNCIIRNMEVESVYTTIPDWKTCTIDSMNAKWLYFNDNLVTDLHIYNSGWPSKAFSHLQLNSLTVNPGVFLSNQMFECIALLLTYREVVLDNVKLSDGSFNSANINKLVLKNISEVPFNSVYCIGTDIYIPSTITSWDSATVFTNVHIEDMESWFNGTVNIKTSPFTSSTQYLYKNNTKIENLDLSNIDIFNANSVGPAELNKIIFSDKLKEIVNFDLRQNIDVKDLSAWLKVKVDSNTQSIKSLSLNGQKLTKIVIPEDITVVNTALLPDGATIICHENVQEIISSDGLKSTLHIYLKGAKAPKFSGKFSYVCVYVPYEYNYNIPNIATEYIIAYDYINNESVELTTISYKTTDENILILPESELDVVSHEYGKIIVKNWNNTLPDNAFNGCETLTSITVGNLYYIGENCFANCIHFYSDLFSTIKTIGDNAFLNCNLGSIKIQSVTSNAIVLGEGALDGNVNLKLNMDYKDLETYKSAENWSNYADKMEYDNIVIKYVGGDGDFISADTVFNENGVAILKRGIPFNICNYDLNVESITLDTIPTKYNEYMPNLKSVYLNCPCSGSRQYFNYCVNGKYVEYKHYAMDGYWLSHKDDDFKWVTSYGPGTNTYCKTEFPIDGEYFYKDDQFKTLAEPQPIIEMRDWQTKFYVPFEYVEDYKLKWPWYADYIYGYDFNNE